MGRMKFFNSSKSSDVTTETMPSQTLDSINGWFADHRADIGNAALNSTTYYACMQTRCNAIAKLPIWVMHSTDKGKIKANDLDLYKLLKYRPNPFVTPHDFIWATEFQKLEYGNAYWVMDCRHGKRVALYLLDSRRVSIIIDDTGILDKKNSVYYIYNDENHGMIVYKNEEIVHLKNFPSEKTGLKGVSVKKYLYDNIVNEQSAANVLKERYKSGLQDPIVVEYMGDMSQAMQTKIKNKFASMGGTQNVGKVVPIPTEFKVNQLETKLVNNQFFELQGLTSTHIANAFGVKSFQLNNLEKSTHTNIEQQNKAFYSDTLQNVLTSYEQETTYKLLTEDEQQREYFIKFNVDSILRSDLTSRTDSYKSGISYGYMSIAEVREKEDLPYIDGTEKLIIGNGASIPLEDLGKQYVSKGGEE